MALRATRAVRLAPIGWGDGVSGMSVHRDVFDERGIHRRRLDLEMPAEKGIDLLEGLQRGGRSGC